VKALIIEDEPLAVDALQTLISAHAPFIEVVGVARDGGQGLAMINALQPQLIFLDINIPVINGLELLNQLDRLPRIVFTTAYDQYAIKAFEINSVDYLLKPIEQKRFVKTVERLRNDQHGQSPSVEELLTAFKTLSVDKNFTSITVKTGDQIHFISLDEITHFYADEKYVSLNTLESKKHITSFTLQELEQKLPSGFIRVSRSVIINRDHISRAQKLFGKKFTITMRDTDLSKVDTGSAYVENFIKLMN
jgi:two-component system LytT family response regulator